VTLFLKNDISIRITVFVLQLVRFEFDDFNSDYLLSKNLRYIVTGPKPSLSEDDYDYSISDSITDDLLVQMLHGKTMQIRVHGPYVTIAGIRRFVEVRFISCP
jgi:hypothetical protein